MLPGFSCVPRPAAISVVILTLASPALAGQAPVATPSPDPAAVTQVATTPAPASTSPAAAPKPTHYKRNGALIGLGAGMTMVLASGLGGCGDDCGPLVATSVVWGGIGAGIGAWIGAGMTPKPIDRTPASPGTPAFAQRTEGKRVVVTTTDGRQLDGHIVAQWEGIRMDSGALVPFKEVAKVQKVTHRVTKGLAIGLIPGVLIGAMTWGLCEGECTSAAVVIPTLVGAGVGLGVGAAIDATHRNADVIYDSKPHATTTTMSIAPILSKTRKGVAFSMTWR